MKLIITLSSVIGAIGLATGLTANISNTHTTKIAADTKLESVKNDVIDRVSDPLNLGGVGDLFSLSSSDLTAWGLSSGSIVCQVLTEDKEVSIYTATNVVASAGFNIGGTVTYESETYTVVSIGSSVFEGREGLEGTLTIPNTIETIGGGAFRGCTGLTGTLTIPSSVGNIGANAFQSCTGLQALTISTGVIKIARSAFEDCSGLTGSLTIPASVIDIGNSAFKNCIELTSYIMISGELESLEGDVFNGCLKEGFVQFTSENPPKRSEKSAFDGMQSLHQIIVPESALDAYKKAFPSYASLIIPYKNDVIEINSNNKNGYWGKNNTISQDININEAISYTNVLSCFIMPLTTSQSIVYSLVDKNTEIQPTWITDITHDENLGTLSFVVLKDEDVVKNRVYNLTITVSQSSLTRQFDFNFVFATPSSSLPTIAIIGIVIGGVVVLAGLPAGIYFGRKWSRNKQANNASRDFATDEERKRLLDKYRKDDDTSTDNESI